MRRNFLYGMEGGCSLEMMNFGGVKLLSHGGRGERRRFLWKTR